MGKKSRDKGKAGEREVAALLREAGYTEARRGRQYHGGADSPDVEEWQPIAGYEGLYEVSNMGRIKSLPKYNRDYEIILKPTLSSRHNRYSVMLSKSPSDHKRISVHRLVAIAFVENPNEYPEVNHKDENPTNNHANNLEWCTRKYNMNYGTLPQRINALNRRPVVGISENKMVQYGAVRWGKKDGFDGSGILGSIKSGKLYKGLSWRYKNVD